MKIIIMGHSAMLQLKRGYACNERRSGSKVEVSMKNSRWLSLMDNKGPDATLESYVQYMCLLFGACHFKSYMHQFMYTGKSILSRAFVVHCVIWETGRVLKGSKYYCKTIHGIIPAYQNNVLVHTLRSYCLGGVECIFPTLDHYLPLYIDSCLVEFSFKLTMCLIQCYSLNMCLLKV